MRLNALLVTIAIWTASSLLGAEPTEQATPRAGDRTPVQLVNKMPTRNADSLGTTAYAPSDLERPFFAKLTEDERSNGGIEKDYDITAKDGIYVAWFGIVREISEDKTAVR